MMRDKTQAEGRHKACPYNLIHTNDSAKNVKLNLMFKNCYNPKLTSIPQSAHGGIEYVITQSKIHSVKGV
jgi:hypothetical protein